ncbi:Syntaxin 81 [Zostera marina]|uniref:Syntaxin 81 n=1 Tax=Zostera marina TaxID=29655 RepID=A0A0K9NJY9_ZOSMR|nr:Syntaxin 81 [Zostera marina]
MASIRDRTADFKDAVHSVARSLGYTESKMAAVLAKFIMHKPLHTSPFIKAALKTLENIEELNHFIVKHRKDYTDLHRSTEQERDNIEHEVSAFIKACKDQIDILKDKIIENEKNENSKTWLGKLGDSSNVDAVAHKHGVVLILSERLCVVTSQFDRLRSIRFQDAVNKSLPRRNLRRVVESKSTEPSSNNFTNSTESSFIAPAIKIQEQQLLDDETRALQNELSSMLDAVHETETKMVEMSALNHLMSTHVLQQAHQIEYLYEQAIEATMNVEKGNKELSQAIDRNSSSRTFLLLFLFVLTFSVLFLDWYS